MNKFKWIAGLAIVFLLILATNLLDRKEFESIKESFTTIYEDRLVAQDLIFQMSMMLEQKSIAIAGNDVTFFATKNSKINEDIKRLIEKFQQTKLTEKENINLNDFIKDFKSLQETEKQFVDKNQPTLSPQAQVMLVSPIAELNRELFALSKIQMEEGKLELEKANKSSHTVKSLATVEVAFLIVIGLIIQAIILLPRRRDEPSLN